MLELRNFTLKKGPVSLIEGLSFSINKGEVLSIIGSSGSGKSSLLNHIGGFTNDDLQAAGDILLDGKLLNNVPSEKRRIGLLFQDDLLFPHMTLLQNLMIGISASYSRKAKIELAKQALADSELEGFDDRRINTISGGQRARLSLWRMILSEPNAIMLDEPFSSFDPRLKDKIREYFFSHITENNIPTILVTHDLDDVKSAKGKLIDLADFRGA